MQNALCRSILTLAASLAVSVGALTAAQAALTHDGWLLAERVFEWDRDQPAYGEARRHGNSWYGQSSRYEDDHVGGWAIGTFRRQNSGNGATETVTIYPDGSAELRTGDEAPKYGTFAGEMLQFDTGSSRVQPARGGIVIDGSYFNR